MEKYFTLAQVTTKERPKAVGTGRERETLPFGGVGIDEGWGMPHPLRPIRLAFLPRVIERFVHSTPKRSGIANLRYPVTSAHLGQGFAFRPFPPSIIRVRISLSTRIIFQRSITSPRDSPIHTSPESSPPRRRVSPVGRSATWLPVPISLTIGYVERARHGLGL